MRARAQLRQMDVTSAQMGWLVSARSSCKKVRDSLRRLLQDLTLSFDSDSFPVCGIIHHSSFIRRAFTLIELVVVIAVISIQAQTKSKNVEMEKIAKLEKKREFGRILHR